MAQEGSGTRAACAELACVLCYRLVHQPSVVFKSWQTGRAELFEEIWERKQAKAMQGLIQLKAIFCKGSLEEKTERAGAGGMPVVVPAKRSVLGLVAVG